MKKYVLSFLILLNLNCGSFGSDASADIEAEKTAFKELDEDYAKKTHSQHKKALRIEVAAIFLKGVVFLAEVGGVHALGAPGIFAALGGAVWAAVAENKAVSLEKLTTRFHSAFQTFQQLDEDEVRKSLLLSPNSSFSFQRIIRASKNKSCKSSCTPTMARKNANNIREISWCLYNCPPVVLSDYLCEVLGNAKKTVPQKKQSKSRAKKLEKSKTIEGEKGRGKQDKYRDKSKDFEPLDGLVLNIGKIMSDPFLKRYRENLKGQMLVRYLGGQNHVSLVGNIRRYTTVADKMRNADYWSPDASADLKSIIYLLNPESKTVSDINACFSTLCYTTKEELQKNIKKEVALNKKYGLLQSRPKRATLASDEEAKNADRIIKSRENPEGVDSKQPKAKPIFKNYCSYYFARTPINFHSRLKHLPMGSRYGTYHYKKTQERADAMDQANKQIPALVEHFSQEQLTEIQPEDFASLMSDFADFTDAVKKKELDTFKAANPEKYTRIKNLLEDLDGMTASEEAIATDATDDAL